jgi:hypothetical protein
MQFEIIIAVFFSQNTQRTPRGQKADILYVKMRTIQYSLCNVAVIATVCSTDPNGSTTSSQGIREYIYVMVNWTCACFLN